FECQGGGHDLPVDRPDRNIGETTALAFADEAAEQFFLPFGSVDLKAIAFFDHSDLVDDVRPLVEEADDLGINGVDFDTVFFETHGKIRVRHANSHRSRHR